MNFGSISKKSLAHHHVARNVMLKFQENITRSFEVFAPTRKRDAGRQTPDAGKNPGATKIKYNKKCYIIYIIYIIYVRHIKKHHKYEFILNHLSGGKSMNALLILFYFIDSSLLTCQSYIESLRANTNETFYYNIYFFLALTGLRRFRCDRAEQKWTGT